LSHLLSGRNKPSLDFILKIVDVFPDVDLYWILNGKGVFLKIRGGAKTRKQTRKETRPNSGAQISEPTLPENLFSKEITWRRSKENLRRGYSKYYKRICFR
jgi:hypothetical protein